MPPCCKTVSSVSPGGCACLVSLPLSDLLFLICYLVWTVWAVQFIATVLVSKDANEFLSHNPVRDALWSETILASYFLAVFSVVEFVGKAIS